MSLTIQRQDGTTYNTADYGLRLIDFTPDSPAYQTNHEEIDGRDGAVDAGTTVGIRRLNAEFTMIARDKYDFPLLRNEIFKIYHSKEEFYLVDEREPGKRWKVKVDPYTIKRLRHVKGEVNLTFVAAFPYAESIGTTQNDFSFDSELWQFGQGLLLDEESQQFIFTTPSFRVYNAGDVSVDPRDIGMHMKITFEGVSNNLTIRNNTTGDEWNCTETTVAGDTITLDDVRSYKNGISIFKSTNRKLITLQPGWNDFEIIGASGAFSISFDFRFYYL